MFFNISREGLGTRLGLLGGGGGGGGGFGISDQNYGHVCMLPVSMSHLGG